MNIGSIFKLMRQSGGQAGSKAMMMELFSAMGINAEIEELHPQQFPFFFQRGARAAARPGAQVTSLRGTSPDGESLEVLIILTPPQKVLENNREKILDSLVTIQ